MEEKKKHTNLDEFIFNAEIPYTRSKEDVWGVISDKIEGAGNKALPVRSRNRRFFLYSAAAIIVLLFGLTLFFRFHTIELSTPNGQHLKAELPDGSEVQMNAATTLSYHPYWWNFKREIHLDGEAFFEVKKGKNFTVQSEPGRTEVLGTSFNIFARDDKYKVSCFTGAVKVSSSEGESEIIVKHQSIEIKGAQMELIDSDEIIEEAAAWKENRFVFTSVPIREVFEELERQLDIIIILNVDLKVKYTGNFSRGSSAEELLDIICKPLEINYKKTNLNTYEINTE